MAILNAIIENKGNTLIIDFPHSIYDVYEKLLSIGIRKSPNEIMLTDNEDDDIQIKLYSDSDFGNHVKQETTLVGPYAVQELYLEHFGE